jgi:hypothetical protein
MREVLRMDTKTEHDRAIATDTDDDRRQWFNEGFQAGAECERVRILAIEEHGSELPGHEELIARLKADGKTTGDQAAVQLLAAEKKKLAGIAADLHFDAPKPVLNSPTEGTVSTTQKIDSTMSSEQVSDVAKREWATNPKLHREFSGEAQYCAFKKAEAAGRVRILNTRRTN